MSNRLAGEQSLYLRQHSENPVDWYPWGAAALERACAEDRPILLSIGYSACHWCHVMERESFEDPEVARAMNESFVCVKVDREERPDVDGIYMRAVQALTGHGGWPLTVFLTPEGRPFYGGTYFPPVPRHGIPSFSQLLSAIRTAWSERREQISATAGRIGELLRESTLGPEGSATRDGPVTRETIDVAARRMLDRFDPVWGGFGSAPKFPQPVVLEFLLEHHALSGDARSRDAVLHTLRRMAAGGMRDHLGGGFHRYSVDREWLVPHFEKMLYDNALLASVYLRGFQVSGDAGLLEVCRAILDDMIKDFRSPDGGFYAARDADSEGEEGVFYVWTPDEVDAELGDDVGRLFRRAYDVSEGGNFEGRNILHLPHDLVAIARGEGIDAEELRTSLAVSRETLKARRDLRPPPARDEKILAGWNGLMIRALAEVGGALGDDGYVRIGEEGARWLLESLRPGGRLLHQVPAEGGPQIPAFLEDVAGFGNALLSLHEATLAPEWLDLAVELDDEIETRFRDEGTGLLHDTPHDHEGLVVRPRETMDNPSPSGSSLAAELHLRLGRLLGDEDRVERARRIVAREAGATDRYPAGFGRLLAVANRLVHDPIEVAILGRRDDPGTYALLRTTHAALHPGMVVTGRVEGDRFPSASTPLLEGRGMTEGRATAYVCSAFACKAPSLTAQGLAADLAEVARERRG